MSSVSCEVPRYRVTCILLPCPQQPGASSHPLSQCPLLVTPSTSQSRTEERLSVPCGQLPYVSVTPPPAFATSINEREDCNVRADHRHHTKMPTLCSLPAEILDDIIRSLPNSSISTFCQTCKAARDFAESLLYRNIAWRFYGENGDDDIPIPCQSII